MPTKNNILKFKHHFKKLPLPFIIYADFECFTIHVNSCQPNPDKSYSKSYQKHEPSSFCIYLKTLEGMNTNFKPIVYTKKTPDERVSEKFIKHIVKLTHKIYKDYYKKIKPLNLTSQEEKDLQLATKCHICEQKRSRDDKSNEIFKVRDHCHFTGKYRGAAHNECNLKCRKPLILPVIFHNLQGYDAHLFIKQLAKVPGDLIQKNRKNFSSKNLKYDSLILSSFFKHLSPNSLKISPKMKILQISKISTKYLKTILHL